jgi:hypothetical protein
MPNINFPVIAIKGKTLNPLRDIDELSSCNQVAFTNGWFQGLKFVDCLGQVYTIENATQHEVSILVRLYRFIFNPQFKVELDISSNVESSSLEEVKKSILGAINSDRYFWEAGGNFDEIVKSIENEDSIRIIVTNFTNQFYQEYGRP